MSLTSVSKTPGRIWSWAALVVAMAGLGGSLYLSLGMELKACPLCFYQRTFMMSLVAVLVTGQVTGVARGGRLCLLALPLAVGGLGVAMFHVWLEIEGKLECPEGIAQQGTAPQQSLAAFGVLFVLLVLGVSKVAEGPTLWVSLGGVIVLGGLLAVASCTSNPPPPSPPQQPYEKPPEVCRPPFAHE
jgi:disulfide bond formation protein DsbB